MNKESNLDPEDPIKRPEDSEALERRVKELESENAKLKQPVSQASFAEAQVIREMIRHEDGLLNDRLSWFCTIQGLLMAAAALILTDDPGDSRASPMVFTLAATGILVSISTGMATWAAFRAVRSLDDWWKNKKGTYGGPEVIGRRPSSEERLLKWWFRPWIALPLIFGVAWLSIAAIWAIWR